MSTLTAALASGWEAIAERSAETRIAPGQARDHRGTPRVGRPHLATAVAVVLAVWSLQAPGLGGVIVDTLADAYLQVAVFVAGTLAAYAALERWLGIDAGALMARHRRWQVPVAAFLGALPGCGGAIVVMTQYVRGQAGFGAVLAVLTATMGDAAFLLLAQAPATGLAILVLGFVVGVVSGYAVEALHGPDFLRRQAPATIDKPATSPTDAAPTRTTSGLETAWLALLAPGLVLGVAGAFQIDTDALLANPLVVEPTRWIGFAGALLSVTLWAADGRAGQPTLGAQVNGSQAAPSEHGQRSLRRTVIDDTVFVTAWVIAAFLLFEMTVHQAGIDLSAAFAGWAPLAPLIGMAVGLLPGCGPQVIVTTLYLSGAIPLSAQLANAISNDGDALFPAIALAPRTALIATLYSALPALLVGYAWMGLAG